MSSIDQSNPSPAEERARKLRGGAEGFFKMCEDEKLEPHEVAAVISAIVAAHSLSRRVPLDQYLAQLSVNALVFLGLMSQPHEGGDAQ